MNKFLLMAACAASAFAQTNAPAGADWNSYGGTQFSWRYRASTRSTLERQESLPAWMFQTGDYAENLHSTPIVSTASCT